MSKTKEIDFRPTLRKRDIRIPKPRKPRINSYSYAYPSGPSGGAKSFPPLRFQVTTVPLPSHMVNGVSLPGYAAIIAGGGNATTKLSAKFTNFTFTPAWYLAAGSYVATAPGYADYIYEPKQFRTFGYAPPQPQNLLTFPSKEVDLTRNAAAMKFSSKVRERIMTVSGPTALGEIRETIEMVRRPGKSLLKAYKRYMGRCTRRIRKKPRPSGRRALEKWHRWFVDSYLSFTYGVQPLLKDIEGGIDALKKLSKVPSLDVRCKVNGMPVSDTSFSWQYPYQFQTKRVSTCSVQVVGVIRGDIFAPVDTLSRLQQLLGVSWDEVVPTIYNLIPFSFIVDYFSNLNEVVSAGYASDAYVAWASTSTRIRRTVETDVLCRYKYVAPTPSGPYYYRYSVRTANVDGKGLYKETSIDRVEGVPKIRFYFSFPSPKQIVNMAALTSSLTKLQQLYRR